MSDALRKSVHLPIWIPICFCRCNSLGIALGCKITKDAWTFLCRAPSHGSLCLISLQSVSVSGSLFYSETTATMLGKNAVTGERCTAEYNIFSA